MTRTIGILAVLVAVTSACIELPAPLRERVSANGQTSAGGSGGDGGFGGAGGDESGGFGGAGGGESGGSGGPGPIGPLPICAPNVNDSSCATIVQLAPGDFFSCALASDGHVWCWGSNWEGELGDPSRPIAGNQPPGPVPDLADVEEVYAGASWACAKTPDGVSCWGANDRGQLGLLDTTPRLEPTPTTLQNIDRIAVDQFRSCAVTTSDEVYCWGRLLNGQEWYEHEFTATPTLVTGTETMASVGQISLSEAGCALADDGLDLRCWGKNDYGYVGDGTTDLRLSATPVSSSLATPVDLLAGGNDTTCTIGGSPRVLQCWGALWGTATLEPTVMPGVDPALVTDLELGWAHICMRAQTGDVSCIGKSHYGQLGPAGGTGALVTTPVTVLSNVSLLGAGWQHNCALTNGGEVLCWGRNQYGQVQPSSGEQVIRVPALVTFPAPP